MHAWHRSPMLTAAIVIAIVHTAHGWTPDEVAARLQARDEIDYKYIDDDFDPATGRSRRQLPTEIQIQVTAPLFSSRMFDYGAAHNDAELPRAIDVGVKFELDVPLMLYGKSYDTVYINGNGAIGVDANSRQYKTEVFPSGTTMIAPFWNRNDLKKGGHVWYRQETGGRLLERGQSEIRYQYDKSVKVRAAIVVTWEGMQPLGGKTLDAENTNIFQVAVFVSDKGTFVNYIYKNIGWTQGAEAGFNRGSGSDYHALPTSGTGNIMYLEEYGNTGIPGEWMFEIGQADAILSCKPGVKGDTCDEKCSSNEWGADCAQCCHCAEGACATETGQCLSGGCDKCWSSAPHCNVRETACKVRGSGCAANAIGFTETDRCGEPIQRCQCLTGYSGDGQVQCNDVDECAVEGVCHTNAVCINTPGNHFCQCLEGYTGDGVTDCKATFLYDFATHKPLPHNTPEAGWKLRTPLYIFGKERGKLLIASSGIIALNDIPNDVEAQGLDDMGVIGFAPFYGRVDLSNGGDVYVQETTDPDVLTRATQTVGEHYNRPGFVAKSAVIVTYANVSSDRAADGRNTFQANIIGGSDVLNEHITFVEYFYKELEWAKHAEAMIMSETYENSYELPGSMSDGIKALTQLSNIGKPGHWLFRVDEPRVQACPNVDMRPPYCDTEYDSDDYALSIDTPSTRGGNTTTHIDAPPMNTTTTRNDTTVTTTTTSNATASTITTTTTSSATTTEMLSTTPVSPTTRVVTIVPRLATSSRRRPNLIIPQLGGNHLSTANGTRVRVRIIQPQLVQPSRISIVAATPATTTTTATTPTTTTTTTPTTTTPRTTARVTSTSAAQRTVSDRVQLPDSITIVPHTFAPPPPTATTDGMSRTVPSTPCCAGGSRFTFPPPASPSTFIVHRPSIVTARTTTRLTTGTLGGRTGTSSVVEMDPTADTPPPVFVFTTQPPTTSKRTPSVRPNVITAPPTLSPNEAAGTGNNLNANSPRNTIDPRRPIGPYGSDRSRDDDNSSKLAIIIPTAIVGAWLLLLLIIGLVVCCKRRRTRKTLRSNYEPQYHFRQVAAAPVVGRPAAHGGHKAATAPYTSYEEHLEKAARLSNEMNAYNQGGQRLSLYGSYWNVNPNGAPAPQSTSRDPYSYFNQSYYDSCPEFAGGPSQPSSSRPQYNGRY